MTVKTFILFVPAPRTPRCGARRRTDRNGQRTARTCPELEVLAKDAIAEVVETGDSVRLAPMNPFERKIVHDAVAGIDGVHSESEGAEPARRVVILAD